MNENIDVKGIERKAYMMYHQDGLLDIFLGAFLLTWGFSMSTSMAGMAGFWFVVLFPALLWAKRRITYPRLGYAEFCRTRKARQQLVILFSVTMLLGLLVLVLWTGNTPSGAREWLRRYFEICFGGLIAVVLCIKASVHLIKRLYAYAVVVFLAFASAHWYDFHLKYSFLFTGAVVLISGVAVLTGFLRRYPLPAGARIEERG